MKLTAWAVEREGEHGRQVHLLVTLEAESEGVRSPVAVNLLLDRSASMRGSPMAAAVAAAQVLVEQATPRDYLGLLAFDGYVEQLLPLRAMDAPARAHLSQLLDALTTGSGTALHEAVEVGASSVHRLLVPGARPKLLLLTDGEPSVGVRSLADFRSLGSRVAESGVTIHALGLGRYYLPEILEALTGPSGTGFTHVDDAEALPVAAAGLGAELFGEVGTEARLKVRPAGFAELRCRHRYPSRVEGDVLGVGLGSLCHAFPRRALFSGRVAGTDWSLEVGATWTEAGQAQRAGVAVTRIRPESAEGRLVLAVGRELDLVAAESQAWKSLARRKVPAAEAALALAEEALKDLKRLAVDSVPTQRHQERLKDLRLSIEKRADDSAALMLRRAWATDSLTTVSQVRPLRRK